MPYIARVIILVFLILLSCEKALAEQQILNLYVWFGEIPDSVIAQFEKETGIKINYTTYDSNETLYAKIKASANPGYDLIEPSSYFVQRMAREHLLQKLNKNKLTNFQNLNPQFLNKSYDPSNNFSLPYIWGVTGIFFNKKYYNLNTIKSWQDLWSPKFKNQLMLLDDPREVFSVALISLGYSPNDQNLQHIKAAYERLKLLLPNIKLFNSNAMPSIPIDEDAVIGMAWNGDIYKAQLENQNIEFVYPEKNFVIWVDNLAIPRNAPHLKNAYRFINFLMRGDIAAKVTLSFGYPTANQASINYLPKTITQNKIIFPSKNILSKGYFQEDINDKALEIYNHYWQLLRIH